jgi:hypothetical protein
MLYCQLMSLFGYQTRLWNLSGHVVSEVLINGTWELYDADLCVYYYNSQGKVASVEDLETKPDLITNPINRLACAAKGAYSQNVANIYSSTDNNKNRTWSYENGLDDYLLNIHLPARGLFEFPTIFASPIETFYNNKEAPIYTNARLTIPRKWTGVLNIPFLINSIGYDGSHTLSVIGKDSSGNIQIEPTVARWTISSN